MREVAEKVATDTAEELKKAAVQHEGEFPGMKCCSVNNNQLLISSSYWSLRINMASRRDRWTKYTHSYTPSSHASPSHTSSPCSEGAGGSLRSQDEEGQRSEVLKS